MKGKTRKSEHLGLLRALIGAIEVLSDEEIDTILERKVRVRLVLEPIIRGERAGKDQPTLPGTQPSVEHLIEEMQRAQTREEGGHILEAASMTRAELEKVARHLNLPILTQDKIERLREKILEATVGSRLNSAAIRRP